MRISNFLYPPSIARCQHVKVNGVQCGSPALKNRKLCHFHQRWQQGCIQLNANQARRSRYSLDLPILEDANSIQVALMQGMRLLLTNQVDHRTAALLFYALQTASSNLSRTTFEPRPQQVVIDPSSIPDTSLGDDAWYKEEFEPQETETDKDDETGDDLPATVNIQAMADSDSVAPALRPALSGRNPKAAVTAAELPLRSWTDFTAPCSRWWMGQSRNVRACLAGIVPAPQGSCAPSARPCDGGNWSDGNRGVQIRRRGFGTAPEFQPLARR